MQTQPIALTDVVRYLEGVCGEDEARGESFDVGGPEVMTYREMIERIARLRGKRRLIVEIPALTPRLRRTGCTSSRLSRRQSRAR